MMRPTLSVRTGRVLMTFLDHAAIVSLLMFALFWFGVYRLSRLGDEDDDE
jgi:hypothetical protein